MPSSSLEFLYFDLGNVLIKFSHDLACRQMAEVAGITPAQVRQTVFESSLEHEYECGTIDCRTFYRRFCEATDTQPDYAALRHAASAIFEINEPIVPLVRALHQAGHRLGILSNTNLAHWEYCSDGRYQFLSDHFSILALSYELGAMKPDPAIYAAAAKLCDVRPEKIFFVDDREENVAGAVQAGYDAVLYVSVDQFAEDLRQRGLLPA